MQPLPCGCWARGGVHEQAKAQRARERPPVHVSRGRRVADVAQEVHHQRHRLRPCATSATGCGAKGAQPNSSNVSVQCVTRPAACEAFCCKWSR